MWHELSVLFCFLILKMGKGKYLKCNIFLNVKNKFNIMLEISLIFISPICFIVCSYKGQMEVEY